MDINNSYAKLPERFHARLDPAGSPDPLLLAWNRPLAKVLGLADLEERPQQITDWFGGNQPLPGSEPIALAYAGHQFGNFVPQLGDGRALLLGELTNQQDGRSYDIQLKGSGQTPFSRNGDGRAALGPVIREYVVSEAMHRMGVPTTRALAAIRTGEWVRRETALPGGILTRVAASHIRVGTFEYFAARRDKEALQLLLDYAIDRHYPEAAQADSPALAFFAGVLERQARLVAQWMALGFIHGVMNTDNMAISGETIDYGPCAFMDEFEFDKVFSSIDRDGRYAYSAQAGIAQWNLARLAECLLLIEERPAAFDKLLAGFESQFRRAFLEQMAPKLGLASIQPGDDQLVMEWLGQLHKNHLDYTLSFRQLADRLVDPAGEGFGEFETQWRRRLASQSCPLEEVRDQMNHVNPLYIPRNHQIERAIDAANQGDMSPFQELLLVLQKPYTEQTPFAAYAEPPQEEERVYQTFCGT
jgi:uncharacterized protein YdiU (UPF0061 family)